MLDEQSGSGCHLLIVSNNRLLAEAIGSALCDESEFTDFESIRCGEEHSHLCRTQHEPRVVIMDACCMASTADLFSATHRMTEQLPESHIVVLARAADARTVTGCIESGATGFILTTQPFDELLATIRAVKQGHARCSGEVVEVVLARIRELAGTKVESANNAEAQLSDREIEVLQLVEEGLLNKEIARRLGIALSTVKNHLHSAFEKLEVATRRQAVRQALALGVLQCHAAHAVA
ncbi:MAG TPA: response regulator transcription factor [Pirellulaceae bacterium]|nr:response regulator transcription factor [Pirellulaceae bacterium]